MFTGLVAVLCLYTPKAPPHPPLGAFVAGLAFCSCSCSPAPPCRLCRILCRGLSRRLHPQSGPKLNLLDRSGAVCDLVVMIRMPMKTPSLAINLILLALSLLQVRTARCGDLEPGFRNPPDSARPWVYWFVMDGNLSREGITADFEAMQRAGIGGVISWRSTWHPPRAGEVHEPRVAAALQARGRRGRAARPADHTQRRAGLDRQRRAVGQAGAVHAASGRQRRRGRRAHEFRPASCRAPQPRPPISRRRPFRRIMQKAKDEFYRDVAVLAFPTPRPQRTPQRH